MRLWHIELLPVLPRQQLVGQWRECHLIGKEILFTGTPNHILVDPIMDYPIEEFAIYWLEVRNEMLRRGYNVDERPLIEFCKDKNVSIDYIINEYILNNKQLSIFDGWHNTRYFKQCVFNLQEKYDRGGMSEDEWKLIRELASHKKHIL